MNVESPPAYAANLAELPLDAAAAAELPREVLKVLRQRGVVAGPLLLVTSGRLRGRQLDAAPQFQLTSANIGTATSLSGNTDFVAVVLMVDDLRPPQLQSLLAGIAANLEPGVLLILLLRGAALPTLRREAAHLLMLRSGYDRVWPHQYGRTLCISAKRAQVAGGPRTCSIIVPVFNEQATFPELMRRLLDKRLDHLGLEREIILVESNSTDGTREQVAAFATTPGVRILWQDRPRGKGHAVRAGLAAATGDIVLIQDADLEYDVHDYDVLLEPLLSGEAAFVLGSRHSGRPGMRQFTDRRLLGGIFNFGHHCFTLLLNILYVQRMRDPFTMYKVFRRDCLYGLEFECNRFDFDHELLIKLLLKGYRPLEIPVHYRSRSFSEGKKIRPFQDALTWVLADFRYRLQPLRPRLE